MVFTNLLKKLSEPKNNAAFITINILLGVGPLIVPEPFFRAGFIFTTAWTVVVWLISFNAANYIGQSIELINKHHNVNQLVSRTSSERSLAETVVSVDNVPQQQRKKILTFDHSQQFSYLLGEKWIAVPVVGITIYLFGVLISKSIMTGKVLSKLLADVEVLNTFQFWLAVFFIAGGAFSFKSIEKTKVLQVVMISVRFISLLLLIIGSIVIMIQNGGIQDLAPKEGNAVFNSKYFGDVFSNLIFTFMFHHSLPGITKQLTQLSQIKSFLKIGFISAGVAVLSVPLTACMAFGNDLIDATAEGMLGSHHHLKYYNQDFKDRIDFIYYFVSFYVFLNVAAFSVYIIVIRKNVLALAKPTLDSDKISKVTVFITILLLGLVLIVSFVLKNDIQVVLDFTGGILGAFILFIMPSIQVFKARRLFPHEKSFLNSRVWMPIVMIILGVITIVYNLYQTISNLVE